MKELAKQYDPSQVEDRIYQFWLDGGYFHTKADPDKKPYTIVMPPPNVTGQLHMGHAVDNTMQDILIRTKRMQGYAALWVPGTDHASIATEAKVVEAMRAEGLTKEMVGRDGFLERAWAWKTKYGNRIVSQLKKLGSSCDWERERFTMDEGCSEAVKEVFVRLYDKGLIYRGNRMVNWCPHCNTSISDAEVEYEEKDGSFWHLLYPVKETGEMLELATTRPETMLGDTAVAINGDDPRYAHLHGCHVVLPLLNKEIPIVCDEHADMTKGTGVVKITPAHDPNDFEVGLRHDLPIVRVFTYDGHMTGAADKAAADALFAAGKNTVNEPQVLDCGKYAGMTTLEARKAILADLEAGRLPEGDRAPQARGGHLLPLPLHHRAHGVQAVVRQDGAAGKARHRERGEGRDQVRARALHQELYELDEEHPRLVHQPSAVVGPSDPGMVLRRLRRDRGGKVRSLQPAPSAAAQS